MIKELSKKKTKEIKKKLDFWHGSTYKLENKKK